MTDYTKLAAEIGDLVTSKQAQYGDSVTKSGRILEILYPAGVQPHQYADVLMVVRILDKLSRIAQRGPDGQDLGGESPYRDIAGYGLLGTSKDEASVVEDAPAKIELREGSIASSFAWESAYRRFRDAGNSVEDASRMADEEIKKAIALIAE